MLGCRAGIGVGRLFDAPVVWSRQHHAGVPLARRSDRGDQMMQFLECRGVGKIYASKAGPVEALRGIDLAASEGEFVCLLGLSGCGKSTLLQLIAGLEAPTAGSIRVGGIELDGPSDETSIVFQDHGLFPG
jgi:ABC-type Fe3+/spermidine/putrescine transport system ATPase subunit